jgi:inner membrane protein
MRLPNHLAGGFCLTGFFSSVFFSLNVLAAPALIAAVVAGSILPDVDNPKSLAGRLLYPIARWLNRKTGHRTLTHSVLFIASLALVCAVAERTFAGEVKFTTVLVIAWFVHVILDTFTLQGVQLMFPFSFEPYWMFDRPEARIRNGDFKAEGAFFLSFVVLSFAQQNLWQNGFWTQFNQAFGSMEHIAAEHSRSPDALEISAVVKVGTAQSQVSGTLIEASASKLVLLTITEFQTIGDNEEFVSATFTHTGKPLDIRTVAAVAVSADSLNRLLAAKRILKIEVQANQPFQVTPANSFPQTVSTFAADYLFQPPVFAEIAATSTLDTFIQDRSFQAEIELLQSEIRRIETAARSAADERSAHAATLAELRRSYAATADVSERQRLHEEIEEEEGKKFADVDEARTAELRDQISKIRKQASYKAATQQSTIEQKNNLELSKIQPTRFTGIVTFLLISGSDAVSATTEPPPMGDVDTIFQPKPTQKTYRVVGIKDGDTVEALDEESKTSFVIRLAHVDTPEKSQAFGTKAKQFTADFCFGKQISIEKTDVDRYGRWVCVVFAEGKNLNLELVKAGFAWHYKKYSDAQEYAAAEVAARATGVGIWSDPNPTPPWDFRKAKN